MAQETQQLYTPSGEAVYPHTNYEVDRASEKISQLQEVLEKVVYSVTYELLKNTDIAEWALQASKPSYTADEVGADASGSAQSALSSAKEYSDSTYVQATGYTDARIAELINGAPSTLDTLKEIADAMSENASVVEALEAAVGSKANDTEAQAHYNNGTVHITASERDTWNNHTHDGRYYTETEVNNLLKSIYIPVPDYANAVDISSYFVEAGANYMPSKPGIVSVSLTGESGQNMAVAVMHLGWTRYVTISPSDNIYNAGADFIVTANNVVHCKKFNSATLRHAKFVPFKTAK